MAKGFEEAANKAGRELGLPVEMEIKSDNDYKVKAGKNSNNFAGIKPNRLHYVSFPWMGNPVFRERHQLYRFAAWLVTMADTLPDEEGQEGISFEDVLETIKNL